jgi:hypothetical protein
LNGVTLDGHFGFYWLDVILPDPVVKGADPVFKAQCAAGVHQYQGYAAHGEDQDDWDGTISPFFPNGRCRWSCALESAVTKLAIYRIVFDQIQTIRAFFHASHPLTGVGYPADKYIIAPGQKEIRKPDAPQWFITFSGGGNLKPQGSSRPLGFLKTCRLLIKIWVQDVHRRDLIHRKVVAFGSHTDGFWRRSIINAEGLLLILGYIRMYPGNIILQVVSYDGQADLGSLIGHRDGEAIGESSFDDIARHGISPDSL